MAMAMAIRREKKSPKSYQESKPSSYLLLGAVCLLRGGARVNFFKFFTLKMEVCCSFKAFVGGTTLRLLGTSHQTCLDTT